MNRRQVKRELSHLLQFSALEDIFAKIRVYRDTDLLNALFPCLCHHHELVRWNAVSVFGVVIDRIAQRDMEQARVVMRRFLWMLNDESGGIGWGVPEAMGEVMAINKSLALEFSHMLVSYTLDDGPDLFQDGNFLELPQLQQGVLWGLLRVAVHHKELLLGRGVDTNLARYLDSGDDQVRGTACLLCRTLNISRLHLRIGLLLHDQARFRLYHEGNFTVYRIADVAAGVAGSEAG